MGNQIETSTLIGVYKGKGFRGLGLLCSLGFTFWALEVEVLKLPNPTQGIRPESTGAMGFRAHHTV